MTDTITNEKKVMDKQEKTPQPFKVIVAGGRDFSDFAVLVVVLDAVLREKMKEGSGIRIVSGKAPGADSLGESWAHLNNVKIDAFPAPWADVEGKTASQTGTRANGTQYWKGAGNFRNRQMAEHADALVAFWDGKSRGTRDMIETAKKKGLLVRVFDYKGRHLKNV